MWGLEDGGARGRRSTSSWLMLQCETLAAAAGGIADPGRAADAASRAPDQPGGAGVRAAGSPRAGAAATTCARSARRACELGTEVVGARAAAPTASRAVLRDAGPADAQRRPRPLPRRGRRRAQHRAARARHPDARARPPRGRPSRRCSARRSGTCSATAARHLRRRPPRGAGPLPARRPGRPLALRRVLGARVEQASRSFTEERLTRADPARAPASPSSSRGSSGSAPSRSRRSSPSASAASSAFLSATPPTASPRAAAPA